MTGTPTKRPAVGDPLPALHVQMTLAKARLFSLPKESFHTHDDMAVAIGLKRAAPQGLMAYGCLSRLATDYFGPSWVSGGELNVAFINLLDRDDLLTIAGKVTGVERDGGRTRVTVEIWVDSHRGTRVAAGNAIGYVDE